MKSVKCLAWLGVFLGTALNTSVAWASDGQSLELNIQLVPGIWIAGASGPVSVEYTTNLNQTSGWTLLAKVQATNSPYFYVDATATNAPKRFYRAVSEDSGNTNQPPVNPDPPHLVWIKPGTFWMGSPMAELERNGDEGPQNRVTISKGFWMSQYEITQGEYQSVIGINPSFFKGDPNRPVEQVNWYDATNYCSKLTQRERAAGRLPAGYKYRLPTEAEWEYACRAGTTTRFAYGDDPGHTQLGNYAWYNSNSGNETHPVGQKKPNDWGLYDMLGNVWEWCSDWYGIYPLTGSLTDPRGPSTGAYRVERGGSWEYYGWVCKSASRGYNWADRRIDRVGFRSVLAPGE